MTRTAPLSDFDAMYVVRLPNWGFVGRQDSSKPDPEAVCGGIYDMGKFKDQAEDEAPPPPPPNYADADYVEGFIRQMAETPKKIIIRRFYKLEFSDRKDDVYWAVRMLMDLMDANRATNKRMRELT